VFSEKQEKIGAFLSFDGAPEQAANWPTREAGSRDLPLAEWGSEVSLHCTRPAADVRFTPKSGH
jgi:hypothetical protein